MHGQQYDTSFLIHEPADVYHAKAREYLSSHQLADFRKCPLLYWKKRQGLVPDDDRLAYVLGRAAHVLILEGIERFEAEYAVGGPINPKTGNPFGANTKAYGEWAAAQGKPVLTDTQFDLITKLAAGVDSHSLAVELFSDGVPEGVVRADYCDLRCQGRLDYFHPEHGIIDLKTCDDLTWFEADARSYGYAHQFAFYRSLVKQATGDEVPVHVIAVEKKEPFRCGVWLVAEQTLAVCQRENEAAIERLKQCESSGVWPSGYEERRVFDYV